MISIQQAEATIKNKSDMHEAVCRNGWLPPPYSDSMCTWTFLLGIKEGKYWCLSNKQ